MFFKSAYAGTLPLQGTEIAGHWDTLYNFLVWVSVFFFVLVVGAMIVFAWKYRSRPGIKTTYITHNLALETIWITIPTLLLLVIFGWGYSLYHDMKQAPTDAYEVRAIAKQCVWTFQYDDGRTTAGELYVPMNRPVKVILTAADVLHGFFIPNFRVKQDAVPGMYSSVWFEAKVPGKHQIFCTEYCGTSHSGMLAKLIVLTDEQWSAFTRGKKLGAIPNAGETIAVNDAARTDSLQYGKSEPQRAGASLVQMSGMAAHGKQLFVRNQCSTCHSVDGTSRSGPSLKGVYNSRVELTSGSVIADENYLLESIEKPQAKIVKGYGAGMPPYQGVLSETDLSDVIAYIKTLK